MCHAIRYTRTSRSVVRRYTSKLTGTHDPRRRTLAKSELPKRERCCHYVRPPRERPDFPRQPCFRSRLPWKKKWQKNSTPRVPRCYWYHHCTVFVFKIWDIGRFKLLETWLDNGSATERESVKKRKKEPSAGSSEIWGSAPDQAAITTILLQVFL